jgi:hypothetical protein
MQTCIRLAALFLLLFHVPASAQPVQGAQGARFGEFQLRVTTEPISVQAGQPFLLTLNILDPNGAVFTDFEENPNKFFDLIIVRDGLDEFSRLSPGQGPDGAFGGPLRISVPGRYFLYADFTPRGGSPVTAMAELTVQGSAPTAPALTPHVPGRIATGTLGAEVAVEKVSGAHRIDLKLSEPDGGPVTDMQPFLGAKGMMVFISADGTEFVRGSIVEGGNATAMTVEAHFPRPGLYKAFGEFLRAGKLHELPFVLNVE